LISARQAGEGESFAVPLKIRYEEVESSAAPLKIRAPGFAGRAFIFQRATFLAKANGASGPPP
jgi:hypothetical protein